MSQRNIRQSLSVEVVFAKPYSISRIPGQLEKRVFIGGNYDNVAVLRQIASMVIELGYQPIFALDFVMPRDRTREYSLRLLHNCSYAIFEITLGNGHIVEIERAKDYDVDVLLVYQVVDEKSGPPPSVTQMVLSSSFAKFGYRTFGELREYVQTFLSSEPM